MLFGEVLGVSSGEILPVAGLGLVALVAVAVLYRPLLLTSLVPEIAEAAGLRTFPIELAFLVTVALATTMTVPVVGSGDQTGPLRVRASETCRAKARSCESRPA